MRKITGLQIGLFFTLLGLILVLGIGTTSLVFGKITLGDFRGVTLVVVAVVFVYLYAFVVFRLFLKLTPLHEGEIPAGSQQEFVYHIYLLFFLMLFYPVMRSGFVPVPLMRLVYLALKAHLGKNSYSGGLILDPPFVFVGDNTLIGQGATIIPHSIEGESLSHYPVIIGNNVTIGAGAVVLQGVTIGDGAVVAVGSVVRKKTVIGAGEIWGGVPAKRLQDRREAEG